VEAEAAARVARKVLEDFIFTLRIRFEGGVL